MRRSRVGTWRAVAATLLLVAALGPGRATATAARGAGVATADVVPGQLIVGFRPGVTAGEQAAVVRRHGGSTLRLLPAIGARLVRLPAGRAVAAAALAYGGEPAVRYAEPNAIERAAALPDDQFVGAQWALQTIGAPAAWDSTTGSRAIVVGILDTGIDYGHPDLAANLWSLPPGTGLTDRRGLACAVGGHGYDALTGGCGANDGQDTSLFTPGDYRYGHGTHVAGIVGAVGDNGVGVAGVNWHVGLMALRTLDAEGRGTAADMAEGIAFAVRARAAGVNVRVLTASWGQTLFSQALLDAIEAAGRAGILVVAAAGNEDSAPGADIDRAPFYPASYTAANVIAVTATDQRDSRPPFANIGARSVDLGAPGVGLYSTQLGGDYQYRSGTSMAAATVAGAAALVLAAPGLGNLTVGQLKDRLLYCGVPVPALTLTVTGRRLDVARAIAGDDCGTPPPPPGPGDGPPGPSPPPAGWSPWVARGGILTESPAATAFQDRVYVFARGTDNALYATSSAGVAFTGWRSLGGVLTAAPAAAGFPGHGLYVFAKGTDDALYVTSSADGATWADWTRLGGVLTAPPAAASVNGVLYVLARGADGALYLTRSRDGRTFSGWQNLGGVLTAAPAAAGFGGPLYVFASGADAALYERHSADGAAFTPWRSLGGFLTAAPAATAYQPANGAETLYTFAAGSDAALYERHTTDGATWTDWQSLGGQLAGPPAAAGANGRLYAVVRWVNNELYERHLPP
ncbi:MAG TPA: S8 family serine peptidase [Thermomicrobiales bacterium]|nr:S8 family serine peptidase [Thermomicrobiales bacterium]